MLISDVRTVCTDKTRYTALIERYPLASEAFDVSLGHPPRGNRLANGLLSLSGLGGMEMERAIELKVKLSHMKMKSLA